MGSNLNNSANVNFFELRKTACYILKRRVRFSIKCFEIYVFQGRVMRVVKPMLDNETGRKLKQPENNRMAAYSDNMSIA